MGATAATPIGRRRAVGRRGADRHQPRPLSVGQSVGGYMLLSNLASQHIETCVSDAKRPYRGPYRGP